ncbi:MAG: peptidylprolyl isomerase, partial [Bifidobacteriaceae bacterium]|jgi:peptidyl-prolyl cis-trans isomerase B (cyclophilin B)|nr:peptidylprolyl isomerase [Bifidobacteriaceae bacterium]
MNTGTIKYKLLPDAAPIAAGNFVALAKSGYFNNTKCHRLTTTANFKVLQCGDPAGNGTGGPNYEWGPIENAPADAMYKKAYIAMARRGGNAESMGSQFFLVYGDTSIPADAAGGYSVFGEVTSGIDTIEEVGKRGTTDGSQDGPPKFDVTIKGVELF